MNDIKTWNYESSEIRTIEKNGEPWWVLADVCKALEISNPSKVAQRIDEDERSNFKLGRQGEAVIINESGLYAVILRSDKPQAKPFRKWVTSEVLPTIRRHGAYMTEQTIEKALTNPDFLIELATQLKSEQEQRRKLETTVAVQEQQIAELQPKASYYDVVLNCKDLLSVTSIAKDYGKSGTWLNSYLHEKGIQYKQGKIWLLYQKYAEKGYTSTKTQTFAGSDGNQHTSVHTYWTQKGRLFIYALLKADGILPLIEIHEVA
ncbi:MAG: phage antirepressor KilAC domain-containing protein [Ruminococcus sp.]